jgi:hypothetical protein
MLSLQIADKLELVCNDEIKYGKQTGAIFVLVLLRREILNQSEEKVWLVS